MARIKFIANRPHNKPLSKRKAQTQGESSGVKKVQTPRHRKGAQALPNPPPLSPSPARDPTPPEDDYDSRRFRCAEA